MREDAHKPGGVPRVEDADEGGLRVVGSREIGAYRVRAMMTVLGAVGPQTYVNASHGSGVALEMKRKRVCKAVCILELAPVKGRSEEGQSLGGRVCWTMKHSVKIRRGKHPQKGSFLVYRGFHKDRYPFFMKPAVNEAAALFRGCTYRVPSVD